MGIQFCSRIAIPHLLITMKFLIALCLVASAMALEDSADVKAAKASFNAAFKAAQVGAHASLAPVQGPVAYLADSADVAAAKADFAAAFAPKPVEALPAPALPAYAAPFYGGFYNGYYPYAAGYYGGYYPYAGYGAYPYAFAPYHYAVAPAKEA